MAKFENCMLELDLEAQSPMIHFQAQQNGVTVRASEVKPKMDRFLLRKIEKTEGVSCSELKKREKSLFVSEDHDALNYKMRITVQSRSEVFQMKGFYANRTENNVDKYMEVFSTPKLTIVCFQERLRELIEKYIDEFFLVTNFGTVQGKGFGSFVPVKDLGYKGKLTPKQEQDIAKMIKDELDATQCFAMRFDEKKGTESRKDYTDKMIKDNVQRFYSIMKSGQNNRGYARSFLFQYMHRHGIDNEKAWMKQNKISPVIAKPENVKNVDFKDKNPRYVRALLGTGNAVSYINIVDSRKFRESITIKHEASKENRLDRVSSPIYFKIVKNVVFIAAREVPDEIYGQKYSFSNKKTGKRGIIQTPDKGSFDIQDFLEKYVEYYNGRLRDEIGNIKYCSKVVKINA